MSWRDYFWRRYPENQVKVMRDQFRGDTLQYRTGYATPPMRQFSPGSGACSSPSRPGLRSASGTTRTAARDRFPEANKTHLFPPVHALYAVPGADLLPGHTIFRAVATLHAGSAQRAPGTPAGRRGTVSSW